MKVLAADSTELIRSATQRSLTVRKVLLVCGALSSLLYGMMDVIEGMLWRNYNWLSQEFSRLSSVGAPSRPLHLVLGSIYTVLVVAFGVGVWWSAGPKRALRVVGGALIVYGLVSYVWPQFYPEDLTMPVSAVTNTMHIILTVVTVSSWMLILGFGASIFGKRFRLYSLGTLVTVLVFGALTGSQASALIAGQPTPWLGLTERINIYSFMVWAVVLAAALFRTPEGEPVAPKSQVRV
jgi:Protein of unknown function (DUF998)